MEEITYEKQFSSCGGDISSASSSSVNSVSSSSSISSSSSSSNSSYSIKQENGYHKADVSSYMISQSKGLDILNQKSSPSIGNLNVLVIPVSFSGENDPQPTSENLDDINTAFFGKSSDTGWESLTSFYSKSSYVKLNIKGTVAPLYKDSRTAEKFETEARAYDDEGIPADKIVVKAVNYEKNNGMDLSSYDSDADGFLDAVELVYFTSRPLNNNGGAKIWLGFYGFF